jgi:hypothetical protein
MTDRGSQGTATATGSARGVGAHGRGGRWRGSVLLLVALLLIPLVPAQAGDDAGFALDAELQLSASLQSAVIDPAGRYAYMGENRDQITKVDLATFTVVDSLPLLAGEGTLYTAVIDPAGEFAYFGYAGMGGPPGILKVRLSDMARVGTLRLDHRDDQYPTTSVIDPAGEFAYFGQITDTIVKIDLDDFAVAARIKTPPNDRTETMTGSAIDTAGHYAYFGTSRGRVHKYNLANFTAVATLQVPTTSPPLSIQAGFADHTDTYVYFRTSDARLLRIRQTDLSVDAGLQLSSDMGPKGPTALIDPAGRYAYLASRQASVNLVKRIDLQTFERAGHVIFPGDGVSAVMDPHGRYAYVGAWNTRLYRFDLAPVSASYVPLPPARVLDTRDDVHGDLSLPIGHRQTRTTAVAGRGGVPADAAAVAINITAVTPTRDSYLTVWPSGATRPTVSSINYAADSIVGNFVIAELGTDGELDLYNHNGQVDVVFDVVGYLPAGTAYRPVTPARVLDTRDDVHGDLAQPVGHRQTRSTTVGGRGGVPTHAGSVAINITAVTPTRDGYLTVWPHGWTRPTASSINFPAGSVVGNFVIAELGNDAALDIYNHNGLTDVVFDVVGYLPAGTDYTPVSPARVLDTRDDVHGELSAPVGHRQTRTTTVAGLGGVPTDATAVAINITAVTPTRDGYLTVWPSGTTRPTISSINFPTGAVVGNFVIAELGTDGQLAIYNHNGQTDVVFDVVGYYRTGTR